MARILISRISGLSTWESWEKWHLNAALVVNHRKYYKRGRWWLPSSPSHGESCEFVYAHGSFVHQKCFNYVITNLLFGLCRLIWIIDLLVTRSNPHPGAWTCNSTPKVLRMRECTQHFFLLLFSFWARIWINQGVWGASHAKIIKRYIYAKSMGFKMQKWHKQCVFFTYGVLVWST